MPTDDWGKIQKLFLAAADLPPAEQQRFLDGACADDPPLRREIESLLPSDRDGEQSIAAAVAGADQPAWTWSSPVTGRTSSGPAFLAAVRPGLAAISASAG